MKPRDVYLEFRYRADWGRYEMCREERHFPNAGELRLSGEPYDSPIALGTTGEEMVNGHQYRYHMQANTGRAIFLSLLLLDSAACMGGRNSKRLTVYAVETGASQTIGQVARVWRVDAARLLRWIAANPSRELPNVITAQFDLMCIRGVVSIAPRLQVAKTVKQIPIKLQGTRNFIVTARTGDTHEHSMPSRFDGIVRLDTQGKWSGQAKTRWGMMRIAQASILRAAQAGAVQGNDIMAEWRVVNNYGHLRLVFVSALNGARAFTATAEHHAATMDSPRTGLESPMAAGRK